MKYLTHWILAIAFVLFAFTLPGYAGSVDLPTHGESKDNSFRIDCGNGKVLVGLKGKKGMFLGKLQGMCRQISTEGRLIGATTYTEESGGAGGIYPIIPQSLTITCPGSSAVEGMSGNFVRFVKTMSLHCYDQSIPIANGIGVEISVTAPLYVGDETPWNVDRCPNSKAVRGFYGTFNAAGVASIGLICHAGTTPNMEVLAAPDGVADVNLASPTGPPSNTLTPFVQLSWMDRSTYESGFRVTLFNYPATQTIRNFDLPTGNGIGSRQAINISDLPPGSYIYSVCAKFSEADGGDRCSQNTGPIWDSFGIVASPTCIPRITRVVQRGAGTGEVFWTHTCTNPTNFVIHAISGNTVFTPIVTPNGTARKETFSFQNGINSEVRVCAVFPNEGDMSFCSAPFPFLFTGV